jgi:hypothetical protein
VLDSICNILGWFNAPPNYSDEDYELLSELIMQNILRHLKEYKDEIKGIERRDIINPYLLLHSLVTIRKKNDTWRDKLQLMTWT